MAQAFAEPQVAARGLVVALPVSKENQPVAQVKQAQAAILSEAMSAHKTSAPVVVRTVASPLRLQATPPVLRRTPPALGEHTQEVLAELGLNVAYITDLRQRHII